MRTAKIGPDLRLIRRGGGTQHIRGVGMLVGKIKPLKEINLGVAEAFFDP